MAVSNRWWGFDRYANWEGAVESTFTISSNAENDLSH